MSNTNNVPSEAQGNDIPEKTPLWKSEQGYRAVATNLPGSAVFIVDHDLRYLLADGESLYNLGFQPSDFEGKTLLEAAGPAQAALYEPLYRQVLAGKSFSQDSDIFGRFFQTRGVPLRDERGHIFAALAVSYDVTERRQTEEALRQSEQEARFAHARTARILESISDAFYALDAEFRLTYVNNKTEELWGKSREALIGRHHWTEFPAAIGSESYHRHLEVMTKREPVHFETISPIFYRWIDVSIYPTSDGGIAVYFRDISERRRAEEALREMNEQLEERVEERTWELTRMTETRQDLLQRLVDSQEQERRRISRELHDQTGQHLTGLALGLKALEEVLTDRYPGEEDAIEMLQPLRITADELAADLHRIAVDLRPTALDDLGIVPALRSYVERWSESSGTPAEVDSFDIDGVEQEETGQEGHSTERLSEQVETTVYRIVQEALTNTMRHGTNPQTRATRVQVTLQRFDGRLQVTVEDNGPGFNVEAAQRSGRLGLAGMQERAALCGGTLQIESEPGKGTTIILRVPVNAA